MTNLKTFLALMDYPKCNFTTDCDVLIYGATSNERYTLNEDYDLFRDGIPCSWSFTKFLEAEVYNFEFASGKVYINIID